MQAEAMGARSLGRWSRRALGLADLDLCQRLEEQTELFTDALLSGVEAEIVGAG